MYRRNHYLSKIKEELVNYKILFLIWPRQVGKTSLLLSLSEYWIVWKHVYVSFDEVIWLNTSFDNSNSFLDFIWQKWGDEDGVTCIILDEIQVVNNIWILLKGLHDKFKREKKKIKIIASGSGSLNIFRWISDSLIWRKTIINVYPFSFKEFLEYNKFDVNLINNENIYDWMLKDLLYLFEEYISYGWYPEVVFTKYEKAKLQILTDIYKDYVYKDISFFLKEKEIINFEKFLKLVGHQVWSLMKIDKVVQDTWISRRSIEKFLFLVENTFVLGILNPYVKNKKKEVFSHKKTYFIDLWILRKITWVSQIEWDIRWKFVENFVYLELLKYKDSLQNIYFWQKKSQSEIDFILENEFDWTIIPIEVKAWNKTNMPIIFKSFYKDYSNVIDKFVILNKQCIESKKYNDTIVELLPYVVLFSILNN